MQTIALTVNLKNTEKCLYKGIFKMFDNFTYKIGDKLTKKSGSNWSGSVVGFYTTDLTVEGYAIESFTEKGSVQIYPVKALIPYVE